jgi:nucleoside-diphosphate-sugar epimerase
MKKKIVITGGLGYIGTELCKIYSGESQNNEIIVIDNQFFSYRVNQLSNWNIKFIQGNILDKNFINDHIKDADIIHHLAGITDVAYVKKDENKERDDLIKATAIDGTQNVLDAMSKDAKIIFPSTHVIFEGLKKTKYNILENEKPSTFLAYSSSKVANEKQLKSSGKNYIILRLGSVYGFSGDSTRINIMPNLFSKIASQNGKIKLFSGGKQIKSLTPIIDVARCFKFMEEENLKKEVYNLTKDTVTVKEVAELCKKFNNKLSLESTNDEIPNLGYTLSNEKILQTGFKFIYKLEENIKEMIYKWSEKIEH